MKEIYDEVYKTIPGYGSVNHGGRVQQYIVDEIKPDSVLDVGCGRGQFCLFLDKHGIKTIGLDISAPFPEDESNVDWQRRDLMSMLGMSAEWVTSFDVLEHIPEEDIDDVFSVLGCVATKGFVFSICFRDSVFRVQGQSLHPTVRPAEWWKEKLSRLGTVTVLQEYDTYGYYRVDK
jgi:cyclopropane fatty-acyl-phospholipid synthase-like methyltransferase